MAEKISMSLDEIIRSTKSKRGSRRGGAVQRGKISSQGRNGIQVGSGRGGIRRNQTFISNLRNISIRTKNTDIGKLFISNLDFGVCDSDIFELFAEFGPVKKAALHYDRSGRSLGTADVIFQKKNDAVRAMKQYHGVPLDGRIMNIALATADFAVEVDGRADRNKNTFDNSRSPRGGRNIHRGRRSRNDKNQGRKKQITAAELDADLDAYTKERKNPL